MRSHKVCEWSNFLILSSYCGGISPSMIYPVGFFIFTAKMAKPNNSVNALLSRAPEPTPNNMLKGPYAYKLPRLRLFCLFKDDELRNTKYLRLRSVSHDLIRNLHPPMWNTRCLRHFKESPVSNSSTNKLTLPSCRMFMVYVTTRKKST